MSGLLVTLEILCSSFNKRLDIFKKPFINVFYTKTHYLDLILGGRLGVKRLTDRTIFSIDLFTYRPHTNVTMC